MVKNIELEQLVINKLTQEQFDSIEEKNPAELYFITDAEADGGTGAQVEEMPEATEMNAGQIVQYVGETITGTEATAVITQTVGNSLTDLKVDAEKFGKASGLTEAGSVEFYTTGGKTEFVSDELQTNNNPGLTVKIDSDKFFDWLSQFENIDINTISQVGIECVVNSDSSISNWGIDIYFDNNTSRTTLMEHLTELPEDSGISYEVTELDNFNIWCRAYFEIAPKNIEWFVDNQAIDVNQYGITYSGTPSNGDTLKVDYTPFVVVIYEKGYFYVNQAQPSDSVVAYKWNQINVQPESEGGLTKEEADQTYLPLAGGTLTGKLNIKPEVSATVGDVLTLSYGDKDVVIKKNRYNNVLDFGGATLTIGNLMASNSLGLFNIGSPTASFGNIYVAQISSSTSYSDTHYLTVPNKDGTIATVEDIDAAVGDISTALTAILGE